jgi:DNA-binding HxlR family transcriptional regulator
MDSGAYMNRAVSQFVHHASFTADTLCHGKWRINIICAMRSGPVRLGQLARMIPKASKKVLTQNLRVLEAAGIVTRRDLSDVVLHIEYELNPDIKGSVLGLLDHLAQWGEAYLTNEIRQRGGETFLNAKDLLKSKTGKGPGGGT